MIGWSVFPTGTHYCTCTDRIDRSYSFGEPTITILLFYYRHAPSPFNHSSAIRCFTIWDPRKQVQRDGKRARRARRARQAQTRKIVGNWKMQDKRTTDCWLQLYRAAEKHFAKNCCGNFFVDEGKKVLVPGKDFQLQKVMGVITHQ